MNEVEIFKFGILINRKKVIMKQGIHPDYKKTVIKCVCGNEIGRNIQVWNLEK